MKLVILEIVETKRHLKPNINNGYKHKMMMVLEKLFKFIV